MLGSEGLGLGSVGTANEVGGGAAKVSTLAQVYAAGAAAPSVDDLMAMASGTSARFQANTDANPLPLIGLYETGASKPLTTSGYPSFGQSLATDLSILIGGRVFNWYEMFDPLWNGTFSQLAGYTWHVETCSFQQQPGTAWRRNHAYADRSYSATKNWQPQATPAGPLGSGPGTMLHLVSLYNTLDDSEQPVDQLDGFGQNIRQVSPIQNGVIYETATHFSHRLIVAPAANDGVGWGVWDGNFNHGGDVPQAAWSARTVGASSAGDWYLAFSLRDTAGDGLLHDIATLARTGITFNAPVTFPTASGQPLVAYSVDVDAMTPGSGGFPVPARVGQAFTITRYTNMVVAVAGVCTGPPTFDVGAVGPTFNEILSNFPQLNAAQINLGVGQQVSNNVTGYHLTSSAAVRAVCHTAGTGTTGLTIRITFYGFWTAL